MTILQEIQKWSAELPAWQREAIARLFGKGSLGQDDEEDIYALLKAEHGIADPKGRIAGALDASRVAAPATDGNLIQIVAVRDLKHVNALAGNQKLQFAPTGLTVVYGDNGSGKSGYSRVLKKACRARDQGEAIHPDARLPVEQTGKAEATFDVLIDGLPAELKWTDGTVSPEDLSSMAIFDTHCARAYLDEQGDFSYSPYGFDILGGLAKLCARRKRSSGTPPSTRPSRRETRKKRPHCTGNGQVASSRTLPALRKRQASAARTPIAPASRQKRAEKAAIYRIDGVSVDATDLLNIDFEVLDLVSDAIARVSAAMAQASGDDRSNYLSEVLTTVLDRQSDRVLELSARLVEADDSQVNKSIFAKNTRPKIVAQCTRLNRLGDRAEKSDYVSLFTGGQDDFSALSIVELQKIIPSDKWLEMQIRLRASAMLVSTNLVKVARWVARGLDVRHAINKVLVDNEIYANNGQRGVEHGRTT